MRMRKAVPRILALAGAVLAAGCRDVTAPVRVAPSAPRLAAQPSKGVWTVTTLDDPGAGSCTSAYCSLRDAIEAAQSGDKIVFKGSLVGSIHLANVFDIAKDLTIDGGGRITLDGHNDCRVLVIHNITTDLVGLTITGARVSFFGAGILNDGNLTITNVTVVGNRSDGQGGGIYNDGTLTVRRSTVSGNTGHLGGGIYNTGTLTVTASTISDNYGDDGGAIYSEGTASPTITITSSTITNNTSTGSLVTDNGIVAGVSGIKIVTGGVRVRNDIIAGNYFTLAGLQFAYDCNGFVTSFGYTLTSSAACFNTEAGPGDVTISLAQVTTEVLEAALKDNGGPTKTHALIERGLAVDAGYCPGETTDQRGFARPYDDPRLSNAADGCDIGAFEWQPPPAKRSK